MSGLERAPRAASSSRKELHDTRPRAESRKYALTTPPDCSFDGPLRTIVRDMNDALDSLEAEAIIPS